MIWSKASNSDRFAEGAVTLEQEPAPALLKPAVSSAKSPPHSFRLVVVVLALLTFASIFIRIGFIENRPYAGRLDGQEPESHILTTLMAMEQSPIATHKFLPIVSLGARYNKFIDEHPGAGAADEEGNYFYTSTPPLTFAMPYLAHKLTGVAPTMQSLRYYNLMLQMLATMALAAFVWLSLRGAADPIARAMATATAAAVYLTAPECLVSHSINLWGQQFTTVLLMVQIILFCFRPSLGALFLLAMLGCLSDWTPYIANSVMAALALWSWRRNGDGKALLIFFAIGLGCLAGGLALIAWNGLVMTPEQYFHALAVRQADRTVQGWSYIYDFIPSYTQSLGVFGLLLFWQPWRLFRWRDAESKAAECSAGSRVILPDLHPLVIGVIIVACALIENLLMADHALRYSYDRLKGVQLLALALALGASHSGAVARRFFAGTVAAGVVSMAVFWLSWTSQIGWHYIAHSQQERIGAVIRATVSNEGPAFFNGDVRAAEVYYAGRNLFQNVDNAAAEAGVTTDEFVRKWLGAHQFEQGVVYEISGSYPLPKKRDLPRTLSVRRVHADGRVEQLGSHTLDEKVEDYHGGSVIYMMDPILRD